MQNSEVLGVSFDSYPEAKENLLLTTSGLAAFLSAEKRSTASSHCTGSIGSEGDLSAKHILIDGMCSMLRIVGPNPFPILPHKLLLLYINDPTFYEKPSKHDSPSSQIRNVVEYTWQVVGTTVRGSSILLGFCITSSQNTRHLSRHNDHYTSLRSYRIKCFT